MDQNELTGLFAARPQNFGWFLGAGSSRSAGLPTATDILWDLKRRFYCREEAQEISRQDIQNDAVRAKIQSFMYSKGFPKQWSEGEYSAYFEIIFGDDKERQSTYLAAMLAEDKVTLSVGNRVLGALLSAGLTRVVFTTNFDSVVEKSVAEMSGKSLSAFHIEGATAANRALNNEEYPLYCKLHGDVRYDSIKNLASDLATQNKELAACFLNAATRIGFIVCGFSGRDESVMDLFREAILKPNAFPHGLFWTGIKGSAVPGAVLELLEAAKAQEINAEYVGIETFDALMLRFWRNIDGKSSDLDAKVRKSQIAKVNIALPAAGTRSPLLRFNALPIATIPKQCLELTFSIPKSWDDLRQARRSTDGGMILAKADRTLCWGDEGLVREVFGTELSSVATYDIPSDIGAPQNTHIKGFVEEALCIALARNKPVVTRTTRVSSFLIATPHDDKGSELEPLFRVVGKQSGTIQGLLTPVDDEHPHAEKVTWAEALRVSIDIKDGKLWLLIDPDVWIWPARARKSAEAFLDTRRANRFNKKYNDLLNAWVQVISGEEDGALVSATAFDGDPSPQNPAFTLGRRTAYSRRAS